MVLIPLLGLIWFIFSLIFWLITLSWSSDPALLSAIRGIIYWILWLAALAGIFLFFVGLYMVLSDDEEGLASYSIKTWWSIAKKTVGKWFVILVLSFGVIFAFSAWFGYAYPYDSMRGLPTDIIVWMIAGNILSALLGWIVALWITTFALHLRKGSKAFWFKDFFSNTGLLWKWWVGQIVYQIIVIGWMILLIIPGIYWAMRFKFRDMFVIDQKMGPIQALKASRHLTKGHRWEVFGLQIAQAGVQILGVFALLIWLFWAVPTSLVAQVTAYKKLLGDNAPTRADDEKDA